MFVFYRGVYPPAKDYVNYSDRSNIPLVEAFRNMQIEEEQELMENGDTTYEVYDLHDIDVIWYAYKTVIF